MKSLERIKNIKDFWENIKIGDIVTICFGNKRVVIRVLSLNEHANKETATSLYELIQEEKIA